MPEWSSPFVPFLVAVAGIALAALLSIIHSHSIYLYGHRVRGRAGVSSFRLAIQNAENVALEGRLRAELTCAPGGELVPESVRIFAGPRGIRGGAVRDRRGYVFEFESLPAYDTWLICCDIIREGGGRVDAEAMGDHHGVVLWLAEIDEKGARRERVLKRLSVDRLAMCATDTVRVVGRARKPLLPLAALTVLLASATYLLTATLWIRLAAGRPFEPSWWVELPLLVGTVAGSWFFFRSAAPPEPRSVQGYLQVTPVSPMGAASAETA